MQKSQQEYRILLLAFDSTVGNMHTAVECLCQDEMCANALTKCIVIGFYNGTASAFMVSDIAVPGFDCLECIICSSTLSSESSVILVQAESCLGSSGCVHTIVMANIGIVAPPSSPSSPPSMGDIPTIIFPDFCSETSESGRVLLEMAIFYHY
jgi:hypothetical protein